jgi:hypothetical protein
MKKNFIAKFFRDQNGQSLMEIIIGLSIGAILIGTASFGIAFTLRSTGMNQNLGTASQLTQGILNNIQSFSNADWQNVYGLAKSSSTQYFLNASGTSFIAVQGQEGVIDNDVTNGLVGEWKFDESSLSTSTVTYDATGNNNNGTLINSPTRASSTCKIANCLSFNPAANNYVRVAATSTLNFSTNGTFSISLWIKPDTLASGWRRGIIMQETYLTSGFRFGFSNGGAPVFWTEQSGGNLSLTSSQSLSLNQWNHLTVVYNNQQGNIYLNGIQVGSSTGTYIAGSNIAYIAGAVVESFSGFLDDVRYYNHALVDDPLTQKVTVTANWLAGGATDQVNLARYLTRWGNFSVHQTDWSGGAGQEGPITNPGSQFSSDSNITTDPLGSFQIQNLSQQ